jgi:hypothetical protein
LNYPITTHNQEMNQIRDSVETIRRDIETWKSPFVELDCFGMDNAERIAGIVDEFCRLHLGASIRGYFFYQASVGSTHGVQLENGRDVVIKVRPPPQTNPYLAHDRTTLGTVCEVMNWLADRGYACPRTVLGSTPLAKGLATVEELLDYGQRGNGFDPACRKTIASGLAELIQLLRSFEREVSCVKHFRRDASLYPQPHSKLFDFEKTAEGAEWIDEFARRARHAENHDSAPLLAHADW